MWAAQFAKALSGISASKPHRCRIDPRHLLPGRARSRFFPEFAATASRKPALGCLDNISKSSRIASEKMTIGREFA